MGYRDDRLQVLSDFWQALRNAAFGRGVTPLVDPKIADAIGQAYEAFHQWRNGDLLNVSLLSDAGFSDAYEQWAARADKLAALVPGMKRWTDPPNVLQRGVTAVAPMLESAGLLVGLGIAVYVWLSSSSRR